MDRALHAIAAALAEVDERELRALIMAINRVPHIPPGVLASIDGIPHMPHGLLVWVAVACHWELHRRQGRDYELPPLDAAIPPDEEMGCIEAANALRAMFPDSAHGVHTLFDALAELLPCGDWKHKPRQSTA